MGWIEGLTACDVALVRRVQRGGSVAPEEWLRFASGVDDLDAALGIDDEDDLDEDDLDEDDLDEDLPPMVCDGSVCCPCGRCDGLEHV